VSQFKDPELGVTTSTRVRDGLPVLLVFHERDGEWQFLSGAEESPDEALNVHVTHLLDDDETLEQLADLPVGWQAWRSSAGAAWRREEIPEDQELL
jgi:hypothetical protein